MELLTLQESQSFTKSAAEAPDDFLLAVKRSRHIRHRLKSNIELPVRNLFASRVLSKIGPFLWQFPSNLGFHAGRVEQFFPLSPRHSAAAASLEQHCDKRSKARSIGYRRLPHAVEVCHPSFAVPEFINLLRKVARMCAGAVAPRMMDLTADLVYCPLQGSQKLYVSGYDERSRDSWADRVAAWACGCKPADGVIPFARPKRAKRDVLAYFDNDAKVRGSINVQALKALVDTLLSKACAIL